MSSKSKEAIILVIDCGKSMSQKSFNCDKSVFELSKQCLVNIIRQKIFAETKNEYLLIEFSTNTTFGVKFNGCLRSPNFELLQYITTNLVVMADTTPGKWQTRNIITALDLTLNRVSNEVRAQNFSVVKVVLFTDFDGFNESDLNQFRSLIIPKLVQNEIKLIIICDFIPNSCSSHQLSESQKLGHELMELIEHNSIGYYYELKSTVHSFNDFEVRKVSNTGQYSNLKLGMDNSLNALTIPICAYTKATLYQRKSGEISFLRTDSTLGNASTIEEKPSVIPIKKVTTFRSQDVIQVEKEEVVRGYPYGKTFVELTEENKKMFDYENKNGKGFKIIGFTSIHNIDVSQRLDSKTRYLFPDHRLKQNNHKLVFEALVGAMISQKKAAIVRYSYGDRTAPRIGYLFPVIEDNKLLLTYIQLPFAEDIRTHRFPSLQSTQNNYPTDKQLKVIDSLIDSMDLMTADTDPEGNPCEALITQQISNPSLQHWFHCLYYRNFNQISGDLPEMSDYLKNQIETPLQLPERMVKPLTQILENFTLESSKSKSVKKKIGSNHNSSQSTSASIFKTKRQRIDRQSEDLEIVDMKFSIIELIASNTSFEVIANKFNHYFKVLFDNIHKYGSKGEEIIDFIELFRKKSIEYKDPKHFNDLMFERIQLFRGTEFWFSLLSKEIKPIGRTECPNSQVLQESIDNFISLSEDN